MKSNANINIFKKSKAFVKVALPYGFVCWWLKHMQGRVIERRVFYYSGLYIRFMRILKFMLPFGLVMKYRARWIGGFGEKFCLNLAQSDGNVRRKKVVLVVHYAERTGAPFLSLHLARSFVDLGYELTIVLLGGGPLLKSFSKIARTELLKAFDFPDAWRMKVKQLFDEGYRNVYLNTAVSGALAKDFKNQGFNVVTLIHEMDYSIRILKLEEVVSEICEYSDAIVVASRVVSDSWRKIGVEVPEDKLKVLPQHNYHVQIRGEKACAKARRRIRRRYGIGEDKIVVLVCGEIGFCKGINQFLDLANELATKAGNVKLMWVGTMPDDLRHSAPDIVSNIINAKNCVFTGFQANVVDFYNAADIYLCCSESDAFPTVVLEAALCKLPVVLAEGYTGVADLFREAPAGLCKELSGHAFASEIIKLISNKTLCQKASDYAFKIGCHFNDFTKYAANLLKLYVGPSVSCIIPNYNYSRYLKARIKSVMRQSYVIDELIILDDNSTDNSDAVIREMLPEIRGRFVRGVKYIRNSKNEGVFRQWARGINEAFGDLVWIAEADDLCTPDLVARLVPFFEDPKVGLAYANSCEIDEFDFVHSPNCRFYTDSFSPTKWLSDYVNAGCREISECLAIMNTIPNASAVLFRREAIMGIPNEEWFQYVGLGDWFMYLNVALKWRIAFCSKTLNVHRRHSSCVMNQLGAREMYEYKMIYDFVEKMCKIPPSTKKAMQNHAYKHDLSQQIDKVCLNDCESLGSLRIMILLSEFGFGGGEIIPIRLANELYEMGYEVFVVSVDHKPRNVEVVEMLNPAISVRGLSEIGSYAALLRYIQENKIQAISSHVWWADYAAYQAVRDNMSVRWMMTMHGCYENLLKQSNYGEKFLSFLRDMLSRADVIGYIADKNLQVFTALGMKIGEKVVKLTNGLAKESHCAIDRQHFGIQKTDKVICLVGRGIPEKGWLQAIKAINLLNNDCESSETQRYHLLLLGDSDYVAELKEQYESKFIHFCGFQQDARRFMSTSDLLVLPSYFVSESQPFVIIEALSCEKPIVASDIGEIPKMLCRDGIEAGVVIPSNGQPVGVEELCSAIETVLDKNNYSRYCEGAKKLFYPYDIRTVANRYLQLLTGEKK